MATFNLNTPNIPDEADILTQVRQIRSYITNLNNQLRYDLSNIDEDNLTGGELPENAISRGFRQKVLDLQGNMSVFEQTATHILARVENAEGDISTLEQTATSFGTRISDAEGNISTIDQTVDGISSRVSTAEGDISTINQTVGGISSTVSSHTGQISAIDQKADNISLAVSQEKVWRAATETALNTALSAAGITKAAGLLWYDTTNNVVKRWTGTAWANTFVNTSQIVIDDDSIDIGTTGTLNMQAGGKITMSSASSIIIGGSPFGVGGANLLQNSGQFQDKSGWVIENGSGNETISVLSSVSLNANILSLGSLSVDYILRTPISKSPIITGQTYTLSFVFAGNIPSSAVVHDSTTYTALSPTLTFPTREQVAGAFYLYKATFVATAGSDSIRARISVPYEDATDYLGWVQLEKGPVATDWSLSPQDTVDALDALDGRLGDVETRVQVFYQTSKPTYTAVGDLWYDTDSNPLEIWKCTNVSTQAHTAFTDPVLTRALTAAQGASNAAAAAQGTANSKINTFVGSSTPTALAPGDLWLDTGNKNIWKRATAAGTGGWVQYLTAAGYLTTTGITIDGTDLTVKATGNLNLAADGNMNVQNGGNLNVLNGGDIEVNNGGDINVASGGKITLTTPNDLMLGAQNITAFADGRIDVKASTIDLSANNSLKLAVSNADNYNNLLLNGAFRSGLDEWTISQTTGQAVVSIPAVDHASYISFFGDTAFRVGIAAGNTDYVRCYQSVPVVAGRTYTFSAYYYVSSSSKTNLSGGASPLAVFFYNSVGSQLSLSSVISIDNLETDKIARANVTLTAPSGAATARVYIRVEQKNTAGTTTIIRFSRLMLSEGSALMPWSPSPSDPASGVKTSKVTINNTGIAMTTGGTFTTTSQNFNIDASGNVVMKGTVEASAGKIAGFSLSGGMLIDTATNGMNLELDPANGVLDVGMMRITKYGTSDGFDLFYQGSQSGTCRIDSGSKSLNLTSEVEGTERSISIGDGIFLFGNTYFKDSVFGYHEDSDSYVPMLNSKNWLDYIYPVGAIYMSSASTSPGTLFGGTWTAITNPPTGAGYWWKRTG